MLINISTITADPSIQPRESLSHNRLNQFAQILESGDELPPVIVFFDGETYWLADGFHRHEAYVRAGQTDIPAEVRHGTIRDAIICGIQVNAAHGIGLSLNERKQAACRLLLDPEWQKWNDSTIIKICRIDRKTFLKIKRRMIENSEIISAQQVTMPYIAPSPEMLQSASLGNPNDRENPEMLQSASLGNPNDALRYKPSDPTPTKVKAFRNDKEYYLNPTNIGRWRKEKQKTTDNELSPHTIDITHLTETVLETLSPSLKNPFGVFKIHSVQFEEPLFSDNLVNCSFKVSASGPTYAIPCIIDMMRDFPSFAQYVYNQAQELAAQANGST